MKDEKFKNSCFVIGEGTLPIQCSEILIKKGFLLLGIFSVDPLVSEWATSNGIPCFNLKSDIITVLKKQPFDYLFSIVNDWILKKEIFSLPKKFAINYHDSILPRLAGVNATTWALLQNEKQHGITWHVITEGIDEGDILKQIVFPISSNETSFSLNSKCYDAAIISFPTLLDDISLDQVVLKKQNLKDRSYFGVQSKPHRGAIISWNNTAEELYALVQALTFGPYPNTVATPKIIINDKVFIVTRIEILQEKSNLPAGTVCSISENALVVATRSKNIKLIEIKSIYRQEIPIEDLVRDNHIYIGFAFSDPDYDLVRQYEQLLTEYARSERFWTKKLEALETLKFPIPAKNQKQINDPIEWDTITISMPEFSSSHNDQNGSQLNNKYYYVAAFLAFISRLASQSEFDVGVGGYKSSEQPLLLAGMFSDTVPLRVKIDETTSFDGLILSCKQELEKIERCGTFALDVIARYPSLSIKPELKSKQVFPVVINLDSTSSTTNLIDSASQVSYSISTKTNKVSLFFNTHLFVRDQFVSFLKTFSFFVEQLLIFHDKPIKFLDLMPNTEILLLRQYCENPTASTNEQCIHQLVEQQSKKIPDQVAIVCGSEHLTYQELNKKANQLAFYLQSVGVIKESIVCLYLERSIDFIICILAAWKLGAGYLPIDQANPKERIDFILNNSKTNILLTKSYLTNKLPSFQGRIVSLDIERAFIDGQNLYDLNIDVHPTNIAYILYTSGTTGEPKGIVIEHRNVNALLHGFEQVAPHGKYLTGTTICPFNFDVSVWEIFSMLCFGGTLHILNADTFSFTGKLIDYLIEHKVTSLYIPPSLLSSFVESMVKNTIRLSIDRILVGVEPIKQIWLQRIRNLNKNIQIINGYGPTETTICATLLNFGNATNLDEYTPIGVPIPGYSVYIVDQYLQPLPLGTIGEILIGGDGVGREYLNLPLMTEQKFLKIEIAGTKGARFFRSGDKGRYLVNGTIEFLGRFDNQVKIRGYRLELEEIEQTIQKYLKDQRVTVSVNNYGPREKELVAYIQIEQGMMISTKDFRRILQDILPDYMIPSRVIFLDKLPLTSTGKVDRQALAQINTPNVLSDKDFLSPQTHYEVVLEEIWKKVLKLEVISINDSFFDLGGHSLLATQIIINIRQEFGIDLSLNLFFNNPTIEKLGQVIEQILILQQNKNMSSEVFDNWVEGEL